VDTHTAVVVLRELKICNHVEEVDISKTLVTFSEDTAAELDRAFQHDKIHRRIIKNKYTNDIIQVPLCSQ